MTKLISDKIKQQTTIEINPMLLLYDPNNDDLQF